MWELHLILNIRKRVYEHKNHLVKGFTDKYNVSKLFYFESFAGISDAIAREKQIKAGSREKELRLIESTNPSFDDLYQSIL